MRRFRAASGLSVGGWGVLRAEPEQEADLAHRLLDQYGLDFYIANAEAEYKFSNDDGQSNERFGRSQRFVEQFRALEPEMPAAVSSYCRADRADIDWTAWRGSGFAFLPQAYVNDLGSVISPAACVEGAAAFSPQMRCIRRSVLREPRRSHHPERMQPCSRTQALSGSRSTSQKRHVPQRLEHVRQSDRRAQDCARDLRPGRKRHHQTSAGTLTHEASDSSPCGSSAATTRARCVANGQSVAAVAATVFRLRRKHAIVVVWPRSHRSPGRIGSSQCRGALDGRGASLQDALQLVHPYAERGHCRRPRWKPASRSRRSWRRAPSKPGFRNESGPLGRGDDPVGARRPACPGDSVNYPGGWGFPLPLPQTARCALDANPPPGPSLTSKVQLLPGSWVPSSTPAAAKDQPRWGSEAGDLLTKPRVSRSPKPVITGRGLGRDPRVRVPRQVVGSQSVDGTWTLSPTGDRASGHAHL